MSALTLVNALGCSYKINMEVAVVHCIIVYFSHGLGSGLGRLMSQRFAKLGCTLVLWDINEQSNEETASQVIQLGAKAHTYVVDLSKKDDIYRAADKVCYDLMILLV